MRSRYLNKRIEVFNLTPVLDGFGGNTVTSTSLGKSWAKISPIQPGKNGNLTDFGLVSLNGSVFITVRKRIDLVYNLETMYFVYRSKKYTISTAPTNINFEDGFITFIGTEEQTKSNV